MSGSSPAGSGSDSAATSAAYGAGRPAHGLRRVVDQDVERAGRDHRVGQRVDLGRVAQVDADDAQPVQPVGAVVHGGEPAHRVVREPGGDRRVRAVAQQAQRDVHADLRPSAGEQRPAAGEVGAGVAPLVALLRAGRAELVIERVDVLVEVLADVAVAGPDQRAGAARRPRSTPAGCPGSRRRCAAVSRSRSRRPRPGRRRRPRPAAAARRCCLTVLKILAVARRTAIASGMLGRQLGHLLEDGQAAASASGSILTGQSCQVQRRAPAGH